MRADIVAGLLFAACGAALTLAGWYLPEGLSGVPGPGFFPMLIGGALLLLGLGLAVQARSPARETHVREQLPPVRLVATIVVLMAVYIALWEAVPFVWRTPLLLIALYRVLGEGWLRSVAIAGGATAMLAGMFEGLLRVRL